MIKPKKSVQNMSAYEVPFFKEDYLYKLDENENLFGPSQKVVELLNNLSDKNVKFYPAYGKLLQKLSEINQLPIGFFLNTNGADEAISVIYSTYLEENDAVLSVTPSFSMPKIYAQMNGAKYVEIPYSRKWEFPLETFLEAIENTKNLKIVHLTTPNNPTGDCILAESLAKILEKSKDKVVVVDETYANYASNLNTELVKKYDNVFIVRSFSKDFALAGLRVGYVVSNPENIVQLTKVRSPYSTNSLAMMAAIEALNDKEHFENVLGQLLKNKKELEDFFKSLGYIVYGTCTNFVLVDVGEKVDFINKKLLQNSIKVRRFNHDMLKNVFRIGIPPAEGVDAIKKVFCKLNKDLLIFDMDGVLVDTRNSYRKAIQMTYEFFSGKAISFAEIQSVKNQGGLNNDWDLTEFLLKNDGVEILKNEIIDKFQQLYWNNGNGFISQETLLIETEILEKLALSYHLAIFTGRPREEAMFTLKKNQLDNYFFEVVAMEDLPNGRQKPCPDGIEMIKQKSYYNKIYYLGDTPDDMLCAKSANVVGIGVLPPQDRSDKLRNMLTNCGAKIVIDNVNEILKIME